MAFLEVEVLNALKCDVSDGLETVSSFFIASTATREGGREADHRLPGGGSGGAWRMMHSGSNRR
jgi:hypothetical protein